MGESKAFFGHFVERYIPFTTQTACAAMDKAVSAQMEMLKSLMGAADQEEATKQIKTEIAKQKLALIKQYSERQAAYDADKDTFNAKAFAVIDKNSNGKLEREEVIEAFFPDSDKNFEFNQALGMMTAAEAEQVKAQQ